MKIPCDLILDLLPLYHNNRLMLISFLNKF
mgnify:CR=1 FL=1